jgi:hypothetical protein
VAERAIRLYSEGWAVQAQLKDRLATDRVRSRMLESMERQLAQRGYYVPFGPVRMVVARKEGSR